MPLPTGRPSRPFDSPDLDTAGGRTETPQTMVVGSTHRARLTWEIGVPVVAAEESTLWGVVRKIGTGS